MGWTYTIKERGEKIKDFFQREFGSGHEILDCKVKNLRTAYLAVKEKETDKVYGMVCLLDYVPNDVYNFGYKEIDETMGPNQRECPESILRLLSDTDNEYAKEWRKNCKENIKKRKELSKFKSGDKIVFDNDIVFGQEKYKEFILVDKRKSLFKVPKNNCALYRIRNWHDEAFTVK